MTEALRQLVTEAAALAGDDLCAAGHDWVSNGGRQCPFEYVDDMGYDCTSQTVYQCSRCGEFDYGDEGGPAFDECDNCHRLAKEAHRNDR